MKEENKFFAEEAEEVDTESLDPYCYKTQATENYRRRQTSRGRDKRREETELRDERWR